MALLLLYTDVYSQSTVIENHPNQNILSESWLKIKNQNNSFITVQETNTTIMHKHSGENNTFPFGYYGLEEPIVQNGDFTPRIYIDSNMNTDDISYVMDLVSSGGVQAYQYLPLGALSLPLQELRDQWILPAVSYGSEVMVGFYPSEEPGISEIPAMLDFLNLVHETDPLGRPVVTYLGYFNISNIEMFGKVVDIDLLGAYPVYKGYPQALMTGVMESGRKALWPMGKRFYAVPETFGPILNRSNGPLLLRNNVYQGVIGGAEGIIFYDESGFNGVKHPEFRAELDRLRDEFVGTGNLGKVVLSPDPPQVVTHKVLEGPTTKIKMNMFEYVRWYDRMQYHLEVYEGDAYLLAANVGGEMLQIEFENLPSESIQAEVLFENRSIAMNAGVFQDTFTPYQVHMYRMSGNFPAGFILDVQNPSEGLITNASEINILGKVEPLSDVKVNGSLATVEPDGSFNFSLALYEGSQEIVVSTPNSSITRNVTLDTQPPVINMTKFGDNSVPPINFAWLGNDNVTEDLFYSYCIDNNDWSLWTTKMSKTYRLEELQELGVLTGSHTFYVHARDQAGNISSAPAELDFSIIISLSPSISNVDGPSKGETGLTYSFTMQAIDPESDPISYRIFWDDGTISEWSDFVPSGQDFSISHQWKEGGKYHVRFQARDIHGMMQPWSDLKFHTIGISGKITGKIPFGYYGLEEPIVQNGDFTPRIYIDSNMNTDDISYVFMLLSI